MKPYQILLIFLQIILILNADADGNGMTDIELENLENKLEGCIIEQKLDEENPCNSECETFMQNFNTREDNQHCDNFYLKLDDGESLYDRNNLTYDQAWQYQVSCIGNSYYSVDNLVYEDIFYCTYHDIGKYLYGLGYIEPQKPLDFMSIYETEECEDLCNFEFFCEKPCKEQILDDFNWDMPSCIEYEFVDQEYKKNTQVTPNFYTKEVSYWLGKCQQDNIQNFPNQESKEYKSLQCTSNCYFKNNDFQPQLENSDDGEQIVLKYKEAEDLSTHHITIDDYNDCAEVCYDVFQCDQSCQQKIEDHINMEYEACQDYQTYTLLERYLGGVHQQYLGPNAAFFLQKCQFSNLKHFKKDTKEYESLLCRGYCLGYNIQTNFPGTFASLEEVEFCTEKSCSAPQLIQENAEKYSQCQKYIDMVIWQQNDKFVEFGYLSYQSLEQLQICLEILELEFTGDKKNSVQCIQNCLTEYVMNEDHVSNFDKNKEQTFDDPEKEQKYDDQVNKDDNTYIECTDNDYCYDRLDQCIAVCQGANDCLDLSCVGVDNKDDLVNKYNYNLITFMSEECKTFGDLYYKKMVLNNTLHEKTALTNEFLESLKVCIVEAISQYEEAKKLLECSISDCIQPGIDIKGSKNTNSEKLKLSYYLLIILMGLFLIL